MKKDIDTIVESVLLKLLEFKTSDDNDKALEVIKSTLPDAGSLIHTVEVPGYTPIFIFETSGKKKLIKEGRAAQDIAFRQIETFLENHAPVTIKIGIHTFPNVSKVIEIPENIKVDGVKIAPIADFALQNSKGEEVAFLSHKMGNQTEHFRQYTGVGKEFRLNINSHHEIQKFKEVYKGWIGENGDVKSITRYVWENLSEARQKKFKINQAVRILPYNWVAAKVINSMDLKRMSLFGHETLTSERGLNAVNFVIQGDISFKEIETGVWELKSAHKAAHDSTLEKMPEAYTPVITVRYASDRDDEDFPFSRVGIYPKEGAHGEISLAKAAKKIINWLP